MILKMSRRLSSGYTIPSIGFGTWQSIGEECENAVEMALKAGYVHIDTADCYHNQIEIGRAIQRCGVRREDLFITSKVLHRDLSYERTIAVCDKALEELATDYLDLYLIHWPNVYIPLEETLGAMNHLVKQGKVRSIGVSNFTVELLTRATAVSEAPICINQVEFHPYLNQGALLEYCNTNDIVLTAYSPLARGKVFKDPLFLELSEQYARSAAQIVLRWLLQKGIVVLPKSLSQKHIEGNFKVFDFELSPQTMERINSIEETERLIRPQHSLYLFE